MQGRSSKGRFLLELPTRFPYTDSMKNKNTAVTQDQIDLAGFLLTQEVSLQEWIAEAPDKRMGGCTPGTIQNVLDMGWVSIEEHDREQELVDAKERRKNSYAGL